MMLRQILLGKKRKSCSVPGCTDTYSIRHRFPNFQGPNESLFREWAWRTDRIDFIFYPEQAFFASVCGCHFASNSKTTKGFLKHDSLPTMKLPGLITHPDLPRPPRKKRKTVVRANENKDPSLPGFHRTCIYALRDHDYILGYIIQQTDKTIVAAEKTLKDNTEHNVFPGPSSMGVTAKSLLGGNEELPVADPLSTIENPIEHDCNLAIEIQQNEDGEMSCVPAPKCTPLRPVMETTPTVPDIGLVLQEGTPLQRLLMDTTFTVSDDDDNTGPVPCASTQNITPLDIPVVGATFFVHDDGLDPPITKIRKPKKIWEPGLITSKERFYDNPLPPSTLDNPLPPIKEKELGEIFCHDSDEDSDATDTNIVAMSKMPVASEQLFNSQIAKPRIQNFHSSNQKTITTSLPKQNIASGEKIVFKDGMSLELKNAIKLEPKHEISQWDLPKNNVGLIHSIKNECPEDSEIPRPADDIPVSTGQDTSGILSDLQASVMRDPQKAPTFLAICEKMKEWERYQVNTLNHLKRTQEKYISDLHDYIKKLQNRLETEQRPPEKVIQTSSELRDLLTLNMSEAANPVRTIQPNGNLITHDHAYS